MSSSDRDTTLFDIGIVLRGVLHAPTASTVRLTFDELHENTIFCVNVAQTCTIAAARNGLLEEDANVSAETLALEACRGLAAQPNSGELQQVSSRQSQHAEFATPALPDPKDATSALSDSKEPQQVSGSDPAMPSQPLV